MLDEHKVYIHERARRAVELIATDGAVITGNLMVPKARTIIEVLNGTQNFVEIESAKGERVYISKLAIQSLRSLDGAKR